MIEGAELIEVVATGFVLGLIVGAAIGAIKTFLHNMIN